IRASEVLIHADIILWKHILGHFEASGTQIKKYHVSQVLILESEHRTLNTNCYYPEIEQIN
ncbi:MAG: hypothetical protein ACQEUB_12650, partial [Thermodesulfobacteriota bacterium]